MNAASAPAVKYCPWWKMSQKDKIVRAATELFRRYGFAATGLSDIIEKSRAPKGSLYYYFPDGKDGIAVAAVRYAGDRVRQTLQELAASTDSPANLVRSYGKLVAGWMAESEFRDGSPITTVLLERAPENVEITRVGSDVFLSWIEIIQARLLAFGVDVKRARQLSQLFIMSLEGALVLARVDVSEEPILLAVEEIASLFEREYR